ncbi:patatin-like phospholipase family protein [Streptomyces sp. CBMA156]|uniref:patatin-like phospholipase family protein n=1 Tax=Streptomyces sp. CBMA156 TaxID=1930280 RepID=UPI00294FF1C8|nr:patatin-like phospholipase family protein [Streptomyces sp. CBMA156]
MTDGFISGQGYWDPDHPVLGILRARRDSGSLPGSRADGARVALAVEGGGMRGVVSAAMLCQLEDHGFKNAFDVVYGCSAGGINGAYFLAGNTWYSLSIYYDDLTTRRFVDFSRALQRKPILNLDYSFEHVMERVKPLDYAAVIASPARLAVPVTDVDALRTVVLRDFSSKEELKTALRASAWLPIAVPGTARTSDGRRAVDGGVLTALPFRLALDDGCTHVLSLSTRPMREHAGGTVSPMHRFTYLHLERLRTGLGRGYLAAIRQKYRDQEWLRGERHSSGGVGPHVLDLAPLPWMPELKRHEMDRHLLLEHARTAYETAFCALENRPTAMIAQGRIHAIPRLTVVETANGAPRSGTRCGARGPARPDGL